MSSERPPVLYWACRLMNLLHGRAPAVYRPLYFAYKSRSDRAKLRRLRSAVRPGFRVVDIGANVGFYTRFLATLVGSEGEVHAFEPDAENYRQLVHNTRSCAPVVPHRLAVADRSGKLRLYHSPHLNVDHQTYDGGENRRSEEVDAVALDDYFRRDEIVDLVKVDVQGFDRSVLEGMARTVERSERMILTGEYWPYGLRRAGVEPETYLDLLRDLGFRVEFDRANIPDPDAGEFSFTDFWAARGGGTEGAPTRT